MNWNQAKIIKDKYTVRLKKESELYSVLVYILFIFE